MIFIFDLIRPYGGPMRLDSTQIAQRAFKSLKLVESLAPDFGAVSYKNGPEIRTLKAMPDEWPSKMQKDSFVCGFDTESEVIYRSVCYSSGSLAGFADSLTLNGTSEFNSNIPVLRSLFEALIVEWDASEAVIGNTKTGSVAWLRWLKNDQLLEAKGSKPMDQGWSKRDPLRRASCTNNRKIYYIATLASSGDAIAIERK